jgi:uncharacterized protein YndB with AHSA1/START domain
MLKKILISFAIATVGICLYAAFKPSTMMVSRELLINATPETIFPLINHSKRTNEWMPWVEMDKELVMNYSGPEEGVGSIASWDSKGQMGTGKAEIVASFANQSVQTQLTYTKPMNMSQLAEITLTPSGTGTVVRWSVTGENSFLCRLMTTFMNMDKMVGGQFEQGLAKLKTLAEVK